MTDYYVQGPGYTAYGPYTLDDARVAAAVLAHDLDRDKTVHILGTVECAYSSHYDDELPEMPSDEAVDGVFTPWRD